MTPVIIVTGCIAVTLAVMLVIALSNCLLFPRLAASQPTSCPSVSVLIPARDEVRNVGAAVSALLAQDYPGAYELRVLDDGSSDGTGEAAESAAKCAFECAEGGSPRPFRLMAGAPLADGWTGKAWACWQLAGAATGELLVFTDADVRWSNQALAAAIAMHQQTGAGLLTVWPTQELVTWSERLVVPMMSLAVLAYLPIGLVHRWPGSSAAAACGQCLIFTRACYAACGGHEAVRASVLDDVTLARRVKRAGFPLRMADGAGLIRARMYRSWPEVRDGFAKNILAGHGNSVWLLGLSTLFHLMTFVLPWIWLLVGNGPGRLIAAALCALGVSVRLITAWIARQPLRDAFLLPVSALLMTVIAGRALWWKWTRGGPEWKRRVVRDR